MKRLFYFLIVLSCTLWSCGKSNSDVDDPNNPDNPGTPTNVTLDISTTDLTFEASGGQKEFTIYCNSDWTITNNSNWCKTDMVKGNGDKTITVTTDPYSETEDQNTNLTIKAGDKTKVLTVTQKHGDAIILTKDKFNIPQEGDNITIEVKSNIEYQVSIPYKFQSWIKEAVKSKAVTTKNFSFTITANEDFDKREGYIVFSGNSLKDTVYVYQAQKNQLILTEDTYNIPAEGKDITVELKTNIDYEVNIPKEATSWISQITAKAIRTDQLKFHIAVNDESNNRSAKIVVKDKNSDLSDTVYITQTSQGTYAGDVILTTIEEIKEFSKLRYKKVNGSLKIEGWQITTLVDLDNQIEEITGDLIITCSSLSNFDGLYNIRKIAGHLIINNCNIANFEGLNSLKEIGKDLRLIGRFNKLTNFQGLNNLFSIGGDLSLKGEHLDRYNGCFDELKSFKGLDNLMTIGKSFILSAIDTIGGGSNVYSKVDLNAFNKLTDFQGLDKLEKINESLILKLDITNNASRYTYAIMGFTSLESFNGLIKLKTIGKDFILYNRGKSPSNYSNQNEIDCKNVFKSLKDFSGLGGISAIKGNFLLFNDVDNTRAFTALSSFNGLDNLKEIGGDFHILSKGKERGDYGHYYKSFEGLRESNDLGLNNLTQIGGDLSIEGDVSIDLSGFKALMIINGSFTNTGTSFDIKGINNLITIGKDVDLKINTLSGLMKLETIDGSCKLHLQTNEDESSLSSLKTIKKDLSITSFSESSIYVSLEKLPNLINLTTVGGNFNISNCSITEINSLSNLTQVTGDFSITGCSKLHDFCVITPLLSNYKGTFLIKDCGYNPTKYQILNGECSKQPE